jgi:CubicO group peptidase (beta-lactamase class C family)
MYSINRPSVKFIGILSLLILLFSCEAKKTTPTQGEAPIAILPISINYTNISTDEQAKWQHIIKSFYDGIVSQKLNGQILIAKNGVILFEDYIGQEFLNKAGSKPMNEHTAIHLASCSKTFTAAAILLLQQYGKLNINDLVTKYLPDFPYPTITIKMLLNHRSGILNYVHNLENWGWKTKIMATNNDIYNLIVQNKPILNYTADTKFLYCNTNYALLALLVEKISGKPFPIYLKEHIFQPLQMNDTYVFTPKDTATATLSYDWKGRVIPFNNLDAVYGDKNIYSTARDMYKWDQALYTNLLLTDSSKVLTYAGYSYERPGVKNYGLGWRMFEFPNNKKIIFHNGWWHGNNNAFIRLIEDSATIICLGNKYSRSNYSVMQLSCLFGDYPFEYEAEEKDTAKANELALMNTLKLQADSIRNAKKVLVVKTPVKKDSIPVKKDSIKMVKPKDVVLPKDSANN